MNIKHLAAKISVVTLVLVGLGSATASAKPRDSSGSKRAHQVEIKSKKKIKRDKKDQLRQMDHKLRHPRGNSKNRSDKGFSDGGHFKHGFRSEVKSNTNNLSPIGIDDKSLKSQGSSGLRGSMGPGDELAVNDTPALCNETHVSGLSSSELVLFLTSHSADCTRFLFTYSPAVASIFSTPKVQAVIAEIQLRSGSEDLANAQVYQLLWFVHAAYYLKFFYPTEVTFNTASVTPNLVTAYHAVANNVHFLDTTAHAGAIISEWANGVDGASSISQFYTKYSEILNLFENDLTRLSIHEWRYAIFSIFWGLSREANLLLPQVSNDPNFLEMVGRYSVKTSWIPQYTFLVDDAIYVLGAFLDQSQTAGYTSVATAALQKLTNAYYLHTNPSEAWIETVLALTRTADCRVLSDSSTICQSQIRNSVEAQVMPLVHNFDDGYITVKTPLVVDETFPLYYSAKEVSAQFFRLVGSDQPVTNDINDVLRIRVYGTRSDYEIYAPLLDGISTNNGGMYLEEEGTFITYQRTPQESIYSLEELFRHEYTHYLASRFIIPGTWGDNIYAHERLTWFDEGIAEFMAGASRESGIHPRTTLMNQILNDGSNTMSVSQIVSATYSSGFRFYRYAGIFLHFLNETHREKIDSLITALLSNNETGYDQIIAELATDSALNTEFQQWLAYLVAHPALWRQPIADVPVHASLSTSSVSDIELAFNANSMSIVGNCEQSVLFTNPRFACNGQIRGATGLVQNVMAGQDEINSLLNLLITSISSGSINNFGSMTCYGTDISFVSDAGGYYPVENFSCHGPLAPGFVSQISLPQAASNVNASVLANNTVSLSWSDNSSDETSFVIERGSSVTGPFIRVGLVDMNLTTFVDSSQGAAGTYFYRVLAQKAALGSTPSNVVSITLSGPQAPTSLVAAVTVDKKVHLTWSDQSSNESGFEIERSIPGGSWATIATVGANTTQYLDITAGIGNYYYKVRAVNNAGMSTYSAIVYVQVTINAPSLLTGIYNGSGAQLNWQDNSTEESGFEIARSIPGGQWITIASVGANVTSFLDSGAEYNTYYYMVRAFTASSFSSYSPYVPVNALLKTPTNLSASFGTQGIQLTWTDNSGHEFNYGVERASSASGPWTQVSTLGANSASFLDPVNVAGTYVYRVRALNAVSSSNYSGLATVVVTAPATPSGLVASFTAGAAIRLNWNDNSSNESGFDIQRSLAAAGPWTTVGSVGVNVASFDDMSTLPAGKYFYRVIARNGSILSTVSNSVSIVLATPGKPTNFTVTALSASSIRLVWVDNSNNELGFKIERALASSGPWTEIATVGAGVTSHTSTGLVANTKYFYKIRSYNQVGTSAYTAVASIKTLP